MCRFNRLYSIYLQHLAFFDVFQRTRQFEGSEATSVKAFQFPLLCFASTAKGSCHNKVCGPYNFTMYLYRSITLLRKASGKVMFN